MRARTDHSIIKTVRVRGVLPFYLFTLLLLSSCSLTKDIPDDDQLFRGLKEIVYIDEQDNQQPESKTLEDQKATMKEEIEAASPPSPTVRFSSAAITQPPGPGDFGSITPMARKTPSLPNG